MRKVVLLFALLFCGVITANILPDPTELKNGSIAGKVIDQLLQEPVAYAAIVIKSKTDATNITGGITQEDGTFEIKGLPEGDLILEIQFIGYKTHSQTITISKRNKKINIGVVSILEETEQLEGVEVVA